MTDSNMEDLTYEELAFLVLTDKEAQQSIGALSDSFPAVPRPLVAGVVCIACADSTDLRLDASVQLISMLDAIMSDDDASIAVAASMAKILRHIENGSITTTTLHDDAVQSLYNEDRCATCGNKDRINDVGLCPECQDCDECRKGTHDD